MIKRCPVCNRTYSDESISFCLADGALLSPPHEEAGAETAVMTAPTEPATPSPQIPTIAAPPPKPARETYTDSITPASAGAKRLLLATAGLLILAVSLVGAYWLLMRRRAPQETIAAVTNTNTVDGGRAIPSDTSRETASPRAAPSVAVMPTPQNREKATPTASPQLPAKLVVATPAPTVDVPRESNQSTTTRYFPAGKLRRRRGSFRSQDQAIRTQLDKMASVAWSSCVWYWRLREK